MSRTKVPSFNGQPVTQKEFSAAMKQIGHQFQKADQRFDQMDRKIDDRIGSLRTETQEGFRDLKRFMGITSEDLVHRLQTSLEFATTLPPKIDDHEERISKIEGEIPVIKAAVGRPK